MLVIVSLLHDLLQVLGPHLPQLRLILLIQLSARCLKARVAAMLGSKGFEPVLGDLGQVSIQKLVHVAIIAVFICDFPSLFVNIRHFSDRRRSVGAQVLGLCLGSMLDERFDFFEGGERKVPQVFLKEFS